MRILNWKSVVFFISLILLALAPRFGHAGDPESKSGELHAATFKSSAPQPRLTIELKREEGSPELADILLPFAGKLESWGVAEVEVEPETASMAAAYTVEMGTKSDLDGEKLRVRVWARDGQVLLAFRSPLDGDQSGVSRDEALEESADRLAAWLIDRGWSSSVVSRDGDKVRIHGGRLHKLKPGLELHAVADQDIFNEVGDSLGRASGTIGTLRLISVDERTATAEIISGCEELSEGTEVILAAGVAIP